MKNSIAARESDIIEADPLEPRKLDLSKAVRGKYLDRMQEGTNLVLIEPDLMETFPDAEAVNQALRGLKEIADRAVKRVA